MYQGKFNNSSRGGSMDVNELLAQRQRSAAPSADASQGKSQASRQAAPQSGRPTPNQMPRQDTPQGSRPASNSMPRQGMPQSSRPAPNSMPRQTMPQAARRPQAQPAPAPVAVEEPKRRRGPRLGGVIFYTIYFLCIFLFFGGVYYALNGLNGWLIRFEASQASHKSEEVFQQIFADPDWAALYDAAGVAGTSFEGKDAFVSYMEQKVGDQKLSYVETSAGLSGDKKYIVRLGNEKIATYTLTGGKELGINLDQMMNDPESYLAEMNDIRQWQLGEIQLFYSYENSCRVQTMNGQKVFVNGVELGERNIIQIAGTKAEDYLPMGVTGLRTYLYQVDGLMSTPTIVVTDESGAEVPVTYDAEKDLYVAQTTANTIGAEEEEITIKAAQEYGLFMVKKSTAQKVAKYFDSSSESYKNIVRSEIWWTQKNNGYEFVDVKVFDYCRYNDQLFSAHTTMTMNIKRTDGSIKEFPIDTTLFFERSGSKWLCTLMTNVDVMEPVGQVRLTFMNGDQELTTGFVDNNATTIHAPMVTAPEGKVFSGWFTESTDANGSKTMNLAFVPDNSGIIQVPANTTLEPMVLYAVFE